MTTSTFNKSANPITAFFMITLGDYMDQGEDITDQINDAADLIHNRSKELSSKKYQTELTDAHYHLIQSMDDYLNDMNYFKYLGTFERMKVLRQQKGNIDLQHPSIKILDDDALLDEEIRDVIQDVFDTLDILRAAMSEDTKAELLNLSSAADACNEAVGCGRFMEIDDMDDRMEFTFWMHLSRRLNFYPLSEQMADYLDEQEEDGSEKIERIKARLRGREQEMFPAYLCALDCFDEDDIEMAKHIIAEEDAQDAENELNDDTPDNVIGMFDDDEDEWDEWSEDDVTDAPPLRYPREKGDLTDMFETETDAPKPSNDNGKNGGKLADVIPLDQFRKKKDQPKP